MAMLAQEIERSHLSQVSRDLQQDVQEFDVEHLRVLLAVQPSLHCEVMKERLESEPNVEVVGAATDDVDVLLAIRETEANVVVHSPSYAEELGETIPSVYTHWFDQYPGLKVIAMATDGCACLFEQIIQAKPLAGSAGFQIEARPVA